MNTTNIQTIHAVNRAFEEGKLEDFLARCTPDIRWTMIGMGTWAGADTIRTEWQRMMTCGAEGLPRISVDQVFADDADGAADGTVLVPKADGSYTTMHYCDVYRFRDGKVAELKSYCIEQKQRESESAVPQKGAAATA